MVWVSLTKNGLQTLMDSSKESKSNVLINLMKTLWKHKYVIQDWMYTVEKINHLWCTVIHKLKTKQFL